MSKLFKIAIDAGHGGYKSLSPKVYATAGKRTPDGEPEWEFNNKIAIALEKELLKYEGVEIRRFDDRTGKTDVPLATRTSNAKAWGANVYISIHHNANTGKWGNWTGVETFRGSCQNSIRLANLVHPEFVKAYGLRDRGIKTANLHITRVNNVNKIPSLLLEGCFMDSLIDIKKLRDDKVLQNAGLAIAKGLVVYANLKQKQAPKPITPPAQPKPQYPSAKVTFNNKSISAINIDGLVFVWSREIATLTGAKVDFVNGQVVINDRAVPKEHVKLLDGKGYIHVRRIAEMLGLYVKWNGVTSTVELSK